MKFTKTFAIAACIASLIGSQSFAQEIGSFSATTEAVAENLVANTEDGVLKGKVFVDADGVEKPVAANVTLSSDGVVVDSVEADEEGNFAFEGIEAGSYQLLGSSDGFIGGQAYDVQPFVGGEVGGCSSCNLGLQSVEAPCSTCGDVVYDAPASACGSCGSCGSCGGGGGGLLGRGGGGLLSNRRLLALGAAGGIIAIAVSDDDDDDGASPDQ